MRRAGPYFRYTADFACFLETDLLREVPPQPAPDRLLCLKIASRGDLLLAAPAFRALRQFRPQARITLLVGASCEDVARRLPFFDEIRVIDDGALFSPRLSTRAAAAAGLLRQMRAGYSEICIFHRDARYALLAWLAGIPVRRGLAAGRGGRFLTHPHMPAAREHDVAQYLRMVTAPPRGREAEEPVPQPAPLAGVWRFVDGELAEGLQAARAHGFYPEQGPWVALGFGGGNNVKTRTRLKAWPVEKYRQLAEEIASRGARVVWLGDREDAGALGAEYAGLSLAGKLTVPATAAVLSRCDAAVANDTLLLHLAEAVGTPTVGLFGPTDPAHYGPLGARSVHLWLGEQLACSPCHRDGRFPVCGYGHRCMLELQVDRVLAGVEPHLAAAAIPARDPEGLADVR